MKRRGLFVGSFGVAVLATAAVALAQYSAPAVAADGRPPVSADGAVAAVRSAGVVFQPDLTQAAAQNLALMQAQLPSAAQIAAAAPVQQVNGQTGAVVVPGVVRASCLVSSMDSTGTGSCSYNGFTGGLSFSSPPDCLAQLVTTNASYVYSYPIVTSGLTSATVQEQAALKVLNISLGATTIWTAPPAGTTLRLICRSS